MRFASTFALIFRAVSADVQISQVEDDVPECRTVVEETCQDVTEENFHSNKVYIY